MATRNGVGTCDLLRFFLDRTRFPELDSSRVAVVAAFVSYVNTSGRGAPRYTCYPSHKLLSEVAGVAERTARQWLQRLEELGALHVTKRRVGRRNAPNLYDVTPAVEQILRERQNRRPKLTVIEGGKTA